MGVATHISEEDLTMWHCRQHAIAAFERLMSDHRHGFGAPAPAGTLRGIDVMPWRLVRQKMSRATIVHHGGRKRLPDFEQPKSFYEKLVVSKFFAPIPMPSPADKLGLASFCQIDHPQFAGVFATKWSGQQPIDANLLTSLDLPPGRYFAKSNAGSGTNIAFEMPISDQALTKLEALTSRWLDVQHGVKAGEWWYGLIRPQIFIEADMSEVGASLTDWKFHIGAGRTLSVQVDEDRSTNHRQLMYDREFNYIPESLFFKTGEPFARPPFFEAMRNIAEQIAKPFQYARVDLYHTQGKIYLGEITLAPMGGMRLPISATLDAMMGDAWDSAFFEQ